MKKTNRVRIGIPARTNLNGLRRILYHFSVSKSPYAEVAVVLRFSRRSLKACMTYGRAKCDDSSKAAVGSAAQNAKSI